MLLRGNDSLDVFVAMPFAAFGAAFIALGLWLFAFPPPSCAHFWACSDAPDYWLLPSSALVFGSVLLAVGLLIAVPPYVRSRRIARRGIH
jgi:hypothetical protein